METLIFILIIYIFYILIDWIINEKWLKRNKEILANIINKRTFWYLMKYKDANLRIKDIYRLTVKSTKRWLTVWDYYYTNEANKDKIDLISKKIVKKSYSQFKNIWILNKEIQIIEKLLNELFDKLDIKIQKKDIMNKIKEEEKERLFISSELEYFFEFILKWIENNYTLKSIWERENELQANFISILYKSNGEDLVDNYSELMFEYANIFSIYNKIILSYINDINILNNLSKLLEKWTELLILRKWILFFSNDNCNFWFCLFIRLYVYLFYNSR